MTSQGKLGSFHGVYSLAMKKLVLWALVVVACGGGGQSTEPKTATNTTTAAGAYKPMLQALVDELKSTPNVTVVDSTFGGPAPKADLDAVKARLHVSDKVLALWAEMNGAKITWKGPQDTDGGIEILAVDEAFKDGKGRTYIDDDPPDSPKRKFYILDARDPGTGGDATGIVLDGTDNPAVFYLEEGNELKPLGVKLDGYLRMATKARGFSYWQEAVVYDVSGEDESTIEPRKFRLLMPKVFPKFVSPVAVNIGRTRFASSFPSCQVGLPSGKIRNGRTHFSGQISATTRFRSGLEYTMKGVVRACVSLQ